MTGVVSLPELLAGVGSTPFAPLSEIVAVLLICVTPAGTGLLTVTAKVAEPFALLASAPTFNVQVEPALLFGTQDHPGVLVAALKVVLAGTVSVITMPAAAPVPVLA